MRAVTLLRMKGPQHQTRTGLGNPSPLARWRMDWKFSDEKIPPFLIILTQKGMPPAHSPPKNTRTLDTPSSKTIQHRIF